MSRGKCLSKSSFSKWQTRWTKAWTLVIARQIFFIKILYLECHALISSTCVSENQSCFNTVRVQLTSVHFPNSLLLNSKCIVNHFLCECEEEEEDEAKPCPWTSSALKLGISLFLVSLLSFFLIFFVVVLFAIIYVILCWRCYCRWYSRSAWLVYGAKEQTC